MCQIGLGGAALAAEQKTLVLGQQRYVALHDVLGDKGVVAECIQPAQGVYSALLPGVLGWLVDVFKDISKKIWIKIKDLKMILDKLLDML